jgi:hypothetical protein
MKLDPLTGWGEGEEKEEEMEIQNWLFRTDRVVENTLDGVKSGQMMKVSRWKQQRSPSKASSRLKLMCKQVWIRTSK